MNNSREFLLMLFGWKERDTHANWKKKENNFNSFIFILRIPAIIRTHIKYSEIEEITHKVRWRSTKYIYIYIFSSRDCNNNNNSNNSENYISATMKIAVYKKCEIENWNVNGINGFQCSVFRQEKWIRKKHPSVECVKQLKELACK